MKVIKTPDELIEIATRQFKGDYPNSVEEVVRANHTLFWMENHPKFAVSHVLIELTFERFLVYGFKNKNSSAYLFEKYFEID